MTRKEKETFKNQTVEELKNTIEVVKRIEKSSFITDEERSYFNEVIKFCQELLNKQQGR